MKPTVSCMLEVSWEICNKVGGIYTVIKSKTTQTLKAYPNVLMIGPYHPKKAATDFQQEPTPKNLEKTFAELKTENIDCYYGEWMIKSKPKTILIDYTKFLESTNGIKTHLWEKFKIDSLNTGNDFNDPLVWGWAVGKFIEKLIQNWGCPQVVSHFHEWLSGSALLYLKDKNVPIATVFTTHATILGRTIAGSNQNLYENLDKLNPDEEAKRLNVNSKYTLEKVTAQQSDVFTTVSEITSLEAEKLLGRKPNVVLPNGLDFAKLPDLEEIPTKHGYYKDKIKEFLIPYFLPYSDLDLDKALLFFISGRFEYRNKGLDVFIDSLGQLNKKLKKEKHTEQIIVFIFVPGNTRAINLPLVESKSMFEDVQDEVDDYLPILRRKIVYALTKNKKLEKIFGENFLLQMKKHMINFKKEGKPPLMTHVLNNEQSNPIIQSLYKNNLDNAKENPVKIVYYPAYLNSSDGLLDLDYYPAIWGMHLGIFPSYYEPWGYTPLECAAYGVSSITTDLAGFGKYVENHLKTKINPGIWTIKRQGKKYEDVVKDLTENLYKFSMIEKKERIQNKITAEHFARTLSWDKLIENYIKAHNLAIKKKFG